MCDGGAQWQHKSEDQVNWLRAVRWLARRARRTGVGLAHEELESLAGLAAAKARAYYDPARATCTFRQWIYYQGWRLLLSEIRDEIRRRKRACRFVPFADLHVRRADGEEGCCFDSLLPCRKSWTTASIALLESLSVDERRIVLLRMGRWTYRQIGRRFHISGEAVRLRLRAVRRRLTEEV